MCIRKLKKPLLLCLAVSFWLAGCVPEKNDATTQARQAPLPTVGVKDVVYQDVMLMRQLPGRLEASREAQIRARVTGIVQKRLFEEGSVVKQGSSLFQIDDAPFVADVRSANANVLRAQANLSNADSDVKRFSPLVKANAISKQQYDQAVTAQRLAKAALQDAKAVLENAEIRLEYASVRAPISGRIGRSYVTEGALVSEVDPQPMALIQQINPMYVNITQAASEILHRRALEASGKTSALDYIEVDIILPGGVIYPHKAKMLFTDVTVDARTGQVNLRAEVPNNQYFLLPGLYVRVNVPQTLISNAVLVPKQAVTRTQVGDSVLVVESDGRFAPRSITIADEKDNFWVVTGGLKEGERYIMDGFQKLRGAERVQTVVWTAEGKSNAASAQAAPSKDTAAQPDASEQGVQTEAAH